MGMLFSASSPPITSLLYPRTCNLGQSKSNSKILFSLRAYSLHVYDTKLKVEYTPWLIVGLGNPGAKYYGTRHNIGFDMIDHISRTTNISMNTIQSKALVGIGYVGEVSIMLVKPQAYMNFSGESIFNYMGLPNGVLRLQPKGGHSHHNGIGNPPGSMDMKAFLLQIFSRSERKQIDAGMEQGVAAMKTLVEYGFSNTISRFILGQKYKFQKI